MKDRPILLDDVNMKDVRNDLNEAIYMLHFVDEDMFNKEKIQNVSFSLKVTLNSIDKMMEGKGKK